MTTRYAIGIDLGTTNNVLAYTPLDDDSSAETQVQPHLRDIALANIVALYSSARDSRLYGTYQLARQQVPEHHVHTPPVGLNVDEQR